MNPVFLLAATFSQDLSSLRAGLRLSSFSDEELDSYLDPRVGKTEFLLPQTHAPWAGNYFPMADGGLATRWQMSRETQLGRQNLHTQEEIFALSQDRISRLSPIEKYDLYRGDYSFSATRYELYNRGPWKKDRPQRWEGFCNGVRCAGILMPEPEQPVSVRNPDGLNIIFQPADLKALAGASYFYVENYAQLGSPTRVGRGQNRPNPAVLDAALRYFIGENKRAFVIDANLTEEIWNESVIGFWRRLSQPEELTSEEKAQFPEAVQKIRARTVLFSLGEVDMKPSNEPTKQKVAAGELHKNIKLYYTLFLGADGRAVDGRWDGRKSKTGVDMVWFGSGRGTDEEQPVGRGNPYLRFKEVQKLFEHSTSPAQCAVIF